MAGTAKVIFIVWTSLAISGTCPLKQWPPASEIHVYRDSNGLNRATCLRGDTTRKDTGPPSRTQEACGSGCLPVSLTVPSAKGALSGDPAPMGEGRTGSCESAVSMTSNRKPSHSLEGRVLPGLLHGPSVRFLGYHFWGEVPLIRSSVSVFPLGRAAGLGPSRSPRAGGWGTRAPRRAPSDLGR